MIKKISEIFKLKYPFNYYGWTDFWWKHYRVPKFKRKLFKRFKKYDYCDFDIVESVTEFTFELFCDWFETSVERYTELEQYNINENPTWVPLKELNKAYQYITKYRNNNKDVISKLQTDYFNSREIYWVPTDNPGFVEMKSLTHYYVDLETFYNEDKKIISIIKTQKIDKNKTTKKEREKFDKNSSNVIWDAEKKIIEWDTETLNFIVNNRERFWV